MNSFGGAGKLLAQAGVARTGRTFRTYGVLNLQISDTPFASVHSPPRGSRECGVRAWKRLRIIDEQEGSASFVSEGEDVGSARVLTAISADA